MTVPYRPARYGLLALGLVASVALSGCGDSSSLSTLDNPSGTPTISWISGWLDTSDYVKDPVERVSMRNEALAAANLPNYHSLASSNEDASKHSVTVWLGGNEGVVKANHPTPPQAPTTGPLTTNPFVTGHVVSPTPTPTPSTTPDPINTDAWLEPQPYERALIRTYFAHRQHAFSQGTMAALVFLVDNNYPALRVKPDYCQAMLAPPNAPPIVSEHFDLDWDTLHRDPNWMMTDGPLSNQHISKRMFSIEGNQVIRRASGVEQHVRMLIRLQVDGNRVRHFVLCPRPATVAITPIVPITPTPEPGTSPSPTLVPNHPYPSQPAYPIVTAPPIIIPPVTGPSAETNPPAPIPQPPAPPSTKPKPSEGLTIYGQRVDTTTGASCTNLSCE